MGLFPIKTKKYIFFSKHLAISQGTCILFVNYWTIMDFIGFFWIKKKNLFHQKNSI